MTLYRYKTADVVELEGIRHIAPHDAEGARTLRGVTAFLRYPDFQRSFIRHLAGRVKPGQDFRLLIAPGSIGCEAVTMAILAKEAGLYGEGRALTIDTLDLSAHFTEHARLAQYPYTAIAHLPPAMKSHFNTSAGAEVPAVTVAPDIRKRINILPPGSLLDFQPAAPYDAVFCMNLLQYVGDDLPEFTEKLATLSRGLVCVNRMDRDFGAGNNPFAAHGFKAVALPGNREPSPAPQKPKENWNCVSVFSL
jgi:hypothetical protein